MRRSIGFQQQCYGDDGMWMETQSQQQQQQSYAFHEESWSSDNNYHKKFPGMNMNNHGAFAMDSELSMAKNHGMLGGNHGMFHEGMHGGHGLGYAHGGGKKIPFAGANGSHNHQFSNGGVKYNSGGHHDNYSEETEFEAYKEEHVGAVTAKMDEMRYERHNWGGGENCYANPYGRNKNWKPHGVHKVEWIAKGV